MASVNFYLKSEAPDKNGEVHLLLQVVNGWRSRISIFKVKKNHWSVKKQKLNPGRKCEPDNNCTQINEVLDKLRDRAKKYFLIRMAEGMPTTKEDFENYIKSTGFEKKITFSDVWMQYLNESKHRLTKGTVNSYISSLNLLKDFSNTSNVVLSFESINNHFLQLLSDYFNSKEFSENYRAKVQRNIRTIYNYAIDQQITEPKNLKFLIKSEKTKKVISLTIEELKKLKACERLSETQTIVRDIFLFLCYTGLRISDVRFLKPNIDYNRNVLTIRPKKDSKKIQEKILIKPALEILKKYDTPERLEALPMISDQKFNEIIKTCCEIAEITTLTDKEVFLKDEIRTIVVPKYRLITSHVGRKTFNTLISKILNPSEHTKASGHSSFDILKHYIGNNDNEIRTKINQVFVEL